MGGRLGGLRGGGAVLAALAALLSAERSVTLLDWTLVKCRSTWLLLEGFYFTLF